MWIVWLSLALSVAMLIAFVYSIWGESRSLFRHVWKCEDCGYSWTSVAKYCRQCLGRGRVMSVKEDNNASHRRYS